MHLTCCIRFGCTSIDCLAAWCLELQWLFPCASGPHHLAYRSVVGLLYLGNVTAAQSWHTRVDLYCIACISVCYLNSSVTMMLIDSCLPEKSVCDKQCIASVRNPCLPHAAASGVTTTLLVQANSCLQHHYDQTGLLQLCDVWCITNGY